MIPVYLVAGVSRRDHSLPVKGGCTDAHPTLGVSDLRNQKKYRVLVRGTLHRGELVESSSLHVLPSAFGSTVVLLSEVFR